MSRTHRPNNLPVVTHIASGDLWAGAEVQVHQLCRALRSSGKIRPTAVVFNTGKLHDQLSALEIPVTLADEKHLSPGAMIALIRRHLRQHNTDIVHTHGFKENVLGVAAKVLNRVPYSVRTVHGNPEFNLPWHRLDKQVIKLLDTLTGRLGQNAIIAVSDQLEARLQSRFGDKVLRIHNFIDVETLRQAHFEGSRASRQNGPIKLGIVGRLVPVKRVDLFLETVRLLRIEQGIDVEGVVIGDGPLRIALEEQAESTGIKDFIDFKGFVDPVYPVLNGLDALLMTSDHEGLPMILLEALALEIPVIAHEVGGIPNILAQGGAGVLVSQHTAAGYAASVAQWLHDHNNAEEMRSCGLAEVREEFDVAVNCDHYLRLYHQLLIGKNEPSAQ